MWYERLLFEVSESMSTEPLLRLHPMSAVDVNFTRPLIPFDCDKMGGCGAGTKRAPRRLCSIQNIASFEKYDWLWHVADGRIIVDNSSLLFSWPLVFLFLSIILLFSLFLDPWRLFGLPLSSKLANPEFLLYLALPLCMLFQFEQYGFDVLGRRYGFRDSFCDAISIISGVRVPGTCPVSDVFVFADNVGRTLLSCLIGIRFGSKRPRIGAGGCFALPLIDSSFHLSIAMHLGAYNSGCLSASVILLPYSIWSYWVYFRLRYLSCADVIFSILFGGIFPSITVLVALILRQRNDIGVSTLVVVQLMCGMVPIALWSLKTINEREEKSSKAYNISRNRYASH